MSPVVTPIATVLPSVTSTAFRTTAPVVQSEPGQKKMEGKVSATPGTYTKLPVPPAAPVDTTISTAPAPEGGIPIWVWLAGGAAVVGTGAFLYSRRKKAS